jgi:hypothetical protein
MAVPCSEVSIRELSSQAGDVPWTWEIMDKYELGLAIKVLGTSEPSLKNDKSCCGEVMETS